jgi:hypothetical protein
MTDANFIAHIGLCKEEEHIALIPVMAKLIYKYLKTLNSKNKKAANPLIVTMDGCRENINWIEKLQAFSEVVLQIPSELFEKLTHLVCNIIFIFKKIQKSSQNTNKTKTKM